MIRRPSRVERIVQIVLAVALILIAVEVVGAMNGVVCENYTELDSGKACYPWGWEGPFAEFWSYRSQANYVTTQALHLLMLILAFALPHFSRHRWLNITVMILFPIAGASALQWLPYLMSW